MHKAQQQTPSSHAIHAAIYTLYIISDSGLHLESAVILHCIIEIINLLWQHLAFWERENARNDLVSIISFGFFIMVFSESGFDYLNFAFQTEWFKEKFVKEMNRFLVKGFPYSAQVSHFVQEDGEVGSQGLGRRKLKPFFKNNSESTLLQMALPFFLKDKDDQSGGQAIAKCVPQNLTMCHLLANLTKSPPKELQEKITDFLICM